MKTTTQANRQVWKYSLLLPTSIDTEAVIKLPATYKIVHVGYDPKDGSVALWIEVPAVSDHPDASLNGANEAAHKLWSKAADQAFRVVATGSDIPASVGDSGGRSEPCTTDCLYCDRPSVAQKGDRWAHIGTAIDINFGWVWHVYQKKAN